jgi:hypothetical protein
MHFQSSEMGVAYGLVDGAYRSGLDVEDVQFEVQKFSSRIVLECIN